MLSIFKFYRKWKRRKRGGRERESKRKEETPGILSQVKIYTLGIVSYPLYFFPLLDVKITKKILSRKQTTIYILHPFGSCPVYLQNVFSLHVQIFNT